MNTIKVGLNDPKHIRTDGQHFDSPTYLDETGQLIGESNRYNGFNGVDIDHWWYDGTSTIPIGLIDDEHRNNSAEFRNVINTGKLIGTAKRYVGESPMGQSAWLFTGVETERIGLTDTGHTRADGYQISVPHSMNRAGQVIGTSDQYGGPDAAGISAWFYNGSSSVKIGIYHLDSNPTYNNVYAGLNEAGQVVGHSAHVGPDSSEYIAWYYDPLSDETVPLMLSRSTEGNRYSEAQLFEDGLALGVYALYDGSALQGFRPFYFRLGDVPRDFGSLLGPGFDAELGPNFGFERIEGAIKIDALTMGGTPIFVTVPEPLPSAGDYNGDGLVGAADAIAWRGLFGTTAYPGSGADGNGDAQIDAADYVLWRRRLGQTAAVAPPGDYDGNGIVDAADYIVWRNTLGQTGAGLAADGNPNGRIDSGDYDVWKGHFGQTAGGGAGATMSALLEMRVPEPGSFILAALALIQLVSRRHRATARWG